MLEGFERIIPLKGIPFMTVTSAGLVFSRNVMQRMGRDSYIVFLVNRAAKKIAIQKSREDDEGAFRAFYGSNPTRITYADIDREIKNMTKWDTINYCYKIEGEYLQREEAIVFSLMEAKQLIRRRHRE